MADGPIKPEFPALLADGFHSQTMAELRQLCVTAFPASITRRGIMNGLEEVVRKLNAGGIHGELWVDGSFVTCKIDPSDIDYLLRVASDLYDVDAAKRALIDWASSEDRHASHSCDAYKWVEYNSAHPLFPDSEADRRYWTDWFGGHKPGRVVKGIIVVDLPARMS